MEGWKTPRKSADISDGFCCLFWRCEDVAMPHMECELLGPRFIWNVEDPCPQSEVFAYLCPCLIFSAAIFTERALITNSTGRKVRQCPSYKGGPKAQKGCITTLRGTFHSIAKGKLNQLLLLRDSYKDSTQLSNCLHCLSYGIIPLERSSSLSNVSTAAGQRENTPFAYDYARGYRNSTSPPIRHHPRDIPLSRSISRPSIGTKVNEHRQGGEQRLRA